MKEREREREGVIFEGPNTPAPPTKSDTRRAHSCGGGTMECVVDGTHGWMRERNKKNADGRMWPMGRSPCVRVMSMNAIDRHPRRACQAVAQFPKENLRAPLRLAYAVFPAAGSRFT